jgi:gamma-glutamyltranspeptidase / glutathione hydrolase
VTYRFAFGRPPTVAANGMVATSQPLATRAGLRALESGGNAADAALAAATVLAVTEPTGNSIGGDNFAIVWKDGRADGLDSAGAAPQRCPHTNVTTHGAESVTVPGAVGGWAALAERYGRLGLDRCLSDAIAAAENGFAVTPLTAAAWARGAHVPEEYLPAPGVGEIVRLPDLAGTLRGIAENGPSAFYEGDVARSIASVTWLDEEDLAAHEARWVEPLSISYRGHTVLELPPPTQGVAALEGLGLLERSSPSLASQVRCMQLALEDAFARVRDGADVSDLLEPAFLDRRRAEAPAAVAEPAGGTVYLCAVDAERMAVSFIQSNYMGFGSGLAAPGTGVCLQNRGAGFSVSGAVEPGRRPYHTIIPGMLLRGGGLAGPFGVMGGFLQAQAHVQLVSAIVDDGLDPQAALERPRFMVDGDTVKLEEGLWERDADLGKLGIETVRETNVGYFGGGQAILVVGDALVGGSDPRKDGYAGGY